MSPQIIPSHEEDVSVDLIGEVELGEESSKFLATMGEESKTLTISNEILLATLVNVDNINLIADLLPMHLICTVDNDNITHASSANHAD